MKKTALVAILSLIVGVGAGFGLTESEFASIEERFSARPLDAPERNDGSDVHVEPAHAVVVSGADFNFGTLRRNETREHTFIVTNTGEDLLKLQFSKASCGKCISTNFRLATVQGGEMRKIVVQYRTRKAQEDFSETVEILTNDAENQVLRLRIRGKVTERLRLSENELNVENVSVSDTIDDKFRIFGYHTAELDVLSTELINQETADHFEVEVVDLDIDELDMDPTPLVAKEVKVRIKPGMPVGPIAQTIQLTVKAGEESEVIVPVVGTITSDLSLIGFRNFTRSKNLLTLGRVKREEGTTAKLRIRVGGPLRDQIKLSIESTDPAEVLQAEIGEPSTLNDGAIYMYPLTISVPPGTPSVNRMGNSQGDLARISIATTHPDAKELLVYVRFVVE